jgi:hypothetical protein
MTMTEGRWLAGKNTLELVEFLEAPGSSPSLAKGMARLRVDQILRRFDSRLARLFVCACDRHHCEVNDWSRLPLHPPLVLEAIEKAEQFADGMIPLPKPERAQWTAWNPDAFAAAHQVANSMRAGRSVYPGILCDIMGNPWRSNQAWPREYLACQECDGAGELYGDSFADDGMAPCDSCNGRGGEWGDFLWRSETVQKLAQQAYDERDYGILPVLADALEDAGCTEPEVLRHCRNQGRCPECLGDGVACFIADGAEHERWRVPLAGMTCEPCQGSGWVTLTSGHVRGCWVLDRATGRR